MCAAKCVVWHGGEQRTLWGCCSHFAEIRVCVHGPIRRTSPGAVIAGEC